MKLTDEQLRRRGQVITTILERYDELTDPLTSRDSIASSGSRVPRMPATYTASIREVERLYVQLRSADSRTHWHLAEWYIRPVVKLAHVPKLTRRHGKLVQVLNADRSPVFTTSVVVRRVPGVRRDLAEQGVSWMASSWRLPHEPFLPSELMVA